MINWPYEMEYIFSNNWGDIKRKDINFVQSHKACWEKIDPEEFMILNDFNPRVIINEIHCGHWAYCRDMHSEKAKQYEAIAAVDIEVGSIICEYTGKVCYENDEDGRYMAQYLAPTNCILDMDQWGFLSLDAKLSGNEARYINSTSPTTPSFIKSNATMVSVWIRGQLRIMVYAKKFIPAYHPIILNYDEHAETYFEMDGQDEENLFFTEILLPEQFIPVMSIIPVGTFMNIWEKENPNSHVENIFSKKYDQKTKYKKPKRSSGNRYKSKYKKPKRSSDVDEIIVQAVPTPRKSFQ